MSARSCVVGLVALLGATSCRSRPTDDECARMLDRYVELLMKESAPKADPAEVDRKKAELRARSRDDPQFHACTEEVTKSQLDCALAAPNADVLEQCLVM